MHSIISKEDITDVIRSQNDCAYELFLRICDKISGSAISLLELHELYRMVYSTFVIEGEVCNGGFYQYYGNSTAQEFNAIGIEGFKLIGAHNTVDILQKVYKTIFDQSAIFREEYLIVGIQNAFNKANDDFDEIHIEEYDEQFYVAIEKDDITNLRQNYIINIALNGWVE